MDRIVKFVIMDAFEDDVEVLDDDMGEYRD